MVIGRENKVMLKVVRRTVFDLKGSLNPSSHPENFSKIRQTVKKRVGQKAGHRD